MNGVGGVPDNQQTHLIEQQRLNEAARNEEIEKVGAGQTNTENLSIEHSAKAADQMAGKVSLAAIPTPQDGSLQAMNMLDSSDLQATINGLKSETDEVQAQLQEEAIKQDQTRQETVNSEKLEQLNGELQQVEDGNKCAQQTARICMCIPGINLFVGLPALAAAKSGDNKADAIRAEMMGVKYGPEVGGQMTQLMEDYENLQKKGILANDNDRNHVKQQLNSLHEQGVIDDVEHFELSQMVDNRQTGIGKLIGHSAFEQRLTDMAMGVKGTTLPHDAYPPGMLEANGYLVSEGQTEDVPGQEDGVSEGPKQTDDVDSSEWLTDMAQKMQEAEERDKALSKLQDEIEDTKSRILQSNGDGGAVQQAMSPTKMI